MKHYYVRYDNLFENIYALTYAETAEDAAALESKNFVRCTRTKALAFARNERDRRKYDPQIGGFADADVMPPAWYIVGITETKLYDAYECKGHIWVAK